MPRLPSGRAAPQRIVRRQWWSCPLWVKSGHSRTFARCLLYPRKADIAGRQLDVCFVPKSGHRISRNHGNTLIRTTDYPCRAVLFCLALNSSPANWLAKPHPLASPNFFDCHDPADQPILNARRPGAQTPERHLKPIALERPVRSVPTSASTGAPVCAPASGVVITVTGCTRRCSAVVRTPMYSAIDTSDAPRCQRPPNSSVRSIN
jgi:hypothetical protein